MNNGEDIELHGPRFISNLEGLVLECETPGWAHFVTSARFTGKRNQQWLLQPDNTRGSVAIASLHDGKYLSVRSGGSLVTEQEPVYFRVARDDEGRYSLYTQTDLRLTLPTPPGACIASSSVNDSEEQTKFLMLEATNTNQAALKTGSIGKYSHPRSSVYYTSVTAGQVIVRNHLTTPLYAAVSGVGNNSQWTINPGQQQAWPRSANVKVHLSTAIGDTGEQNAQVYECKTGMMMHVQNLDKQVNWYGVKSIPVEDARYSSNAGKPNQIGVKNDLIFDIYVSVFSTVSGGDTSHYRIKPNATRLWSRSLPQAVFVGVGSAPGLPQAYVGRPGYILHIESWRPLQKMSNIEASI